MAHPKLDELIARLSTEGLDENGIRERALKSGWSAEDVNGALALERLRKNPLRPMPGIPLAPRTVTTSSSPVWMVATLSVLILVGGVVAFGAYFKPDTRVLLTRFLGSASSTAPTFSLSPLFEREPYNPYTFATSTVRSKPSSSSSYSSGSSGGSVATTPAPTPVVATPTESKPVTTAPAKAPRAPRPDVRFTAVADGVGYRITWSSTNAHTCTATGFSTDGAIGGTITVYPTVSKSYSMSCSGDGGTEKKSVSITVAPVDPVNPPPEPPPDPPSLTFTANKTTVASGGSVVLTWNSTAATSCSATGDWSGTKNADGSDTLSNITAAKTYMLTCTGAGGSVSRTIAIALEVVVPPPAPTPAPTLTLTTDKATVASGGSATLTWSATNASSCTATGDWTGSKNASGSQAQTNITAAKSYTLTCTGAGGSIARTVTVGLEAVVVPPATNSTVYSTAQLTTALTAAKGGETILLGAGTYSTLGLNRVTPASMVTVTSADTSNPVLIPGMEIDDSSNLTFKNIEITLNTRTMTHLNLINSTNVHFDRIEFHDPINKNRGSVLLRWGSNLSIKNSEFYHMESGIRVVTTSDIVLSGNNIHDIYGDGIQVNGTSNVTIKNNTLTDLYSSPGDHPDAIQFFTYGQTGPARNITITGNTYTRGNGGITQGIFMGNEASIHYQDVVISGNRIIGGMYNGIAIGGVDRATISNNIVQGYTDMDSWILIGDSIDSILSNNRASSYNYQTLVNTNFTDTNNVIIPEAPVGDTSILSTAYDWKGQLASISSLTWLTDLWAAVAAWFMSLFGK